jgi:uncharacterized protein
MKKMTMSMLLLALSGLNQAQTKDRTRLTNSSISNSFTPVENQTRQVASEFLTAVQKGDNEKLAALLHPNVEWNQPGNNRFSGIKKSSTEVFQMVGGMFELSANSLTLTEVKVLTVNGNQAACLIHWRAAHPTGALLEVDNIDVYTVENNRITKAIVYSENVEQENFFWGK